MPASPKSGSFARACTAPRATSATRAPMPALFSFNSAVGACARMPGLWPGDWRGLGPGDSQRQAHAAHRGHQAHPEPRRGKRSRTTCCATPRPRAFRATLPGASSRPEQKHWVIERLAALERQVEQAVVRHSAAFLSTWRARPTRCTSACCCPSTAATRDLPMLRRRAPEAGKPAVAHGSKAQADAVLPPRNASCPTAWLGAASSWKRCRACACTT